MMITRHLIVDVLHPTAAVTVEAIAEAAAQIIAGALVAFPTETVYGLGANAFDPAAVARIFQAKGRPATDPVIVHIARREQLDSVAVRVPTIAEALIAACWPGPLTLVLARGSRIPANVSAGLPTVAVRMPAHPIALALIAAAGVPIAAPSANRFAHSSPTTAQHVLDDLYGSLALILDSGPTLIGVESTILDLTGDHPRLLRPGGISLEAIRAIVPDVEVIERHATLADGALPAPGMLLKHYAPRATLQLFDGQPEAVRQAMAQTVIDLRRDNQTVGLLIAEEDCAVLKHLNLPMVSLGSLADLSQIARNLFAGLRDLDTAGVDVILARSYSSVGIGLAIRDRLLRAAEGHIQYV